MHMEQRGREWEESWEEMVSWLNWLFELVYLKWASSARALTWCCSRLWHASIPLDWHTCTHSRSHTYSHAKKHKHTETRWNTQRAFSFPSFDLPAVSDTAPMILCLAGCELSEWQGMRRLTCDAARQDQMYHHLLKQRNKGMNKSFLYHKLILQNYITMRFSFILPFSLKLKLHVGK